MSTKAFKIVQPGMLTTVQDLGRLGYQRLGVPVAGAMDPFALRVGNKLVGNPDGEAGVEITFTGPTLGVLTDAIIAVTGADLGARLNGAFMPMWQAVAVRAGDTLAFGGPKSGVRGYLCVAGGIDVPLVMGSRSTYLRSKIGGYQGRALKQDDVLETGQPKATPHVGAKLSQDLLPTYSSAVTLRVVLGPQDDHFAERGLQAFLYSEYTVTPQMDRMGIRLEGPNIIHKQKADIISDGIAFGSVQVPGDGQPIVMMADHQTTGGYTKIATVISVDIPLMAQAQPGDKVKFQKVSVEDAQALYRKREERLAQPLALPKPVDYVTPKGGLRPPKAEPPPAPVVEKTDTDAIIVEHQGRRYAVSEKDGVYRINTHSGARPRRYRVTVEGQTYEVEIR